MRKSANKRLLIPNAETAAAMAEADFVHGLNRYRAFGELRSQLQVGQNRTGRPITEVLAEAERRNATVTLDPDYGDDVNAVIAAHREPWNPPSWD